MFSTKRYRVTSFVAAIAAMALASSAFAQFDATDFSIQNNLGIGTSSPSTPGTNGFQIRGTANPGFGLRENAGSSVTTMINDGVSARLTNRAFSGPSFFWFEPTVDDGTSDAIIRFFRTTNTTGSKQALFFRGNNTTVVDAQIGVDGANSFFRQGNVGIGTISPSAKLHVVGETMTEVLQITGGSDLSESFDVLAPNGADQSKVLPGYVVSISPDRPGKLDVSTEAYDRKVAGVISGAGGLNTGMVMGQQGSLAHGDHPVALTGRVYVYVDATDHPVRPGDLLTTSNEPGHAMGVVDFATAQGAIIGKAMTPLSEGRGLVLALISLQ